MAGDLHINLKLTAYGFGFKCDIFEIQSSDENYNNVLNDSNSILNTEKPFGKIALLYHGDHYDLLYQIRQSATDSSSQSSSSSSSALQSTEISANPPSSLMSPSVLQSHKAEEAKEAEQLQNTEKNDSPPPGIMSPSALQIENEEQKRKAEAKEAEQSKKIE